MPFISIAPIEESDERDFARVLQIKPFGQVLAWIDERDDTTSILKFVFRPPGLGVCSIEYPFGDSDEAYQEIEQLLVSEFFEEFAKRTLHHFTSEVFDLSEVT